MIVLITLGDITKEVELPESKTQVEAAKKIIAKHFKVSWLRQKLIKPDGVEIKNDEQMVDGTEYKMIALDMEEALKENEEEIYEYEEVYYYYEESTDDESGSMYDEYDASDSDSDSGNASSDNQHAGEMM